MEKIKNYLQKIYHQKTKLIMVLLGYFIIGISSYLTGKYCINEMYPPRFAYAFGPLLIWYQPTAWPLSWIVSINVLTIFALLLCVLWNKKIIYILFIIYWLSFGFFLYGLASM